MRPASEALRWPAVFYLAGALCRRFARRSRVGRGALQLYRRDLLSRARAHEEAGAAELEAATELATRAARLARFLR